MMTMGSNAKGRQLEDAIETQSSASGIAAYTSPMCCSQDLAWSAECRDRA
jgi:hypothetical protein